VCQFTFRVVKFPDETKFRTNNNESSSKRDIMLYYQLAYCVDCCVPVYWMCLPESTPVQKVAIKGETYIVFQCEACAYKKAHPDREAPACRECSHSKGYLKKIIPVAQGSETLSARFVHPVCALSFPNIYQMGSPANMSIKLCSGIEINELDKESEPAPICSLCT